jgi:nucleoside 2-deoxyribosyltransferase
MSIERLFDNNFQKDPSTGDFVSGVSPVVGGRFLITGSAVPLLAHLTEAELVGLRRRMWESNRAGSPLRLDTTYLSDRRFTAIPDFSTRADDFLDWLSRNVRFLADAVILADFRENSPNSRWPEVSTFLCIHREGDLYFFLDYLKGQGFIDSSSVMGLVSANLKPAGIQRLESVKRNEIINQRAFVAMWFNDQMIDAWQNGMAPAIEDAGYEPFRIDRHEHLNRIDDEILAQIRTSRFVISDFTSEPESPRGGVYFEAGFALGLGKPVIWTARDNMISHIHFDTRQYNHIFWSDPDDLRGRLYNRIVSVLGLGPLKQA